MTPSNALPVLRASIAANVPAGQEPIPKLLKELWDNRANPNVYNKLLESLHTRREEFLGSLCSFKFDPKALLQILVDYHQRHKVENLPDKTACLIQGGKICFNSLAFQFPLGEPPATVRQASSEEKAKGYPSIMFDVPDFRTEYVAMILQSVANCRSEQEIVRLLDDLGQSQGKEKAAILEKVAKKHWVNSKEFASAFLNAERSTVHNPNLREEIKKAILILIPKDVDPPAHLDLTHGQTQLERTCASIVSAINGVLMHLPWPNQSSARVDFVKSLARARPKWADFFCQYSRILLGKKPNEKCW